jgi:hypothetical protein
MFLRASVAAALVMLLPAPVRAQDGPAPLSPFLLSKQIQQSLDAAAAASDVLLIGETHGTRETSEIGAALLAPLPKLGYGVLAVEVPADRQTALAAWATGCTADVPDFFAKPLEDGRGSVEALRLIRAALSPPYNWKLICFDVSAKSMGSAMARLQREAKTAADGDSAALLESEQVIAVSRLRDKLMAEHFADQNERFAHGAKTLAICGNLHARTANRRGANSRFAAFWPSLAAELRSNHPTWRIRSVNVVPYRGAYFNNGKVNQITPRPLDEAVLRATPDGDWDYELDLPLATPATFLATPDNAAWMASSESARDVSTASAEAKIIAECPPTRRTRRRFRLGRN